MGSAHNLMSLAVIIAYKTEKFPSVRIIASDALKQTTRPEWSAIPTGICYFNFLSTSTFVFENM